MAGREGYQRGDPAFYQSLGISPAPLPGWRGAVQYTTTPDANLADNLAGIVYDQGTPARPGPADFGGTPGGGFVPNYGGDVADFSDRVNPPTSQDDPNYGGGKRSMPVARPPDDSFLGGSAGSMPGYDDAFQQLLQSNRLPSDPADREAAVRSFMQQPAAPPVRRPYGGGDVGGGFGGYYNPPPTDFGGDSGGGGVGGVSGGDVSTNTGSPPGGDSKSDSKSDGKDEPEVVTDQSIPGTNVNEIGAIIGNVGGTMLGGAPVVSGKEENLDPFSQTGRGELPDPYGPTGPFGPLGSYYSPYSAYNQAAPQEQLSSQFSNDQIAGLADAWGVSPDSAAALADAGFNGFDFSGFGDPEGGFGDPEGPGGDPGDPGGPEDDDDDDDE
jgi:hypothetical protein